MSKKRVLSPQSVWDAESVEAAFQEGGIKSSHIMRMYNHLINNPGSTWHDVPDFPRAAVAILDSKFALFTTKLIRRQDSSDGETTKLLIELQDGLQVESVIMSYDTTTPVNAWNDPGIATKTEDGEEFYEAEEAGTVGGQRHTICVSSQVGCQMACTFCATGKMGLNGNLAAGEIIEQLVHGRCVAPIRNAVFMGMGEPLDNYNAVKTAVSLMTHPQAFAMRRRCVTVSTVGVIPRITQLAEDLPGVALALSLHAPNQELRSKIVPSARAYKLDKLMAAIAKYQATAYQKAGNKERSSRVFVEYVLLGPDVNCLPEHAHELGKLLLDKEMTNVIINLIPWNPILSPSIDFRAPEHGAAEEFKRILKEKYKIPCTLRKEKGQDVSAACGQLALEHQGTQGGSSGKGKCGSGGGAQELKDVEDLLKPLAVS